MSVEHEATSNEVWYRRLFQAGASLGALVFVAAGMSTPGHKPSPNLGPIKAPKGDPYKHRDWAFHRDRYDLLSTNYADTVASPNSFLDGLVTIQGFNIRVDEQKLEDTLANDEIVQVAIVDKGADKKHRIRAKSVYANLNSQADQLAGLKDQYADLYDPFLGVEVPTPDQQDNGIDYVNGGLQAIKNQKIVIEKDKVLGRHHLKRLLRQDTDIEFQDNVACPDVDEKIVSEVTFTPAYRQRVCQYLLKVTGLLPNDYTVFLDRVGSELYQDDGVSRTNDDMILSLPFLKDKGDHSPSSGIVLHESLHAAYKKLGPFNPVRRLINRNYTQAVNDMEYRMPTESEEYYDGYPVDKNEPMWAAITESTYEKGVLGYKFTDAGHPWDNPTEMTSSTADVMAVYPDEFLQKYDQLKGYQKDGIRGAVRSTFDLIRESVGQKKIASLIPKYKQISQKLGLS